MIAICNGQDMQKGRGSVKITGLSNACGVNATPMGNFLCISGKVFSVRFKLDRCSRLLFSQETGTIEENFF
ncbi:MAG: hypothetical protein Q4G69_13310 [Planctomycetia bacterium]|nr:hypothetical protein [Planctomycetia bacterium]